MIIKVYCSESEKSQIEKKALAAGFSTSKYLKRQAFADLHSRAMFVEMVSNMVGLIETDRLSPSVGDRLFKIAQDVLDGASLEDGRERVAQVCKFEV
ncbi:MAG: hypothetical protein DCF25_06720 [Leptolyngbya foveolarum]|uniref:Uncharacterized protein n=1 Tax=Leptolyngbya foveolarum TaxID=47253 RepID=A0A2W4UHG3_9CYAN|nr:MAG: hypothetical protein DCF25_06720 [Leptolyngbya foveolarum]